MQLLKTTYPEEDELVMCTVTNIQHHSVFCKLDEYKNKSGMIHISEIAPGRIRNIKEFVQEGKKVICKILRIDEEKGHIDLSLRRVNDGQRKAKQKEIKEENLAGKIIEYVAKSNKLDPLKLHKQIADKILEEYDTIYSAFEDVAKEEFDLSKVGIDKKIAKELTENIKGRITPPEVEIVGEFKLSTTAPGGVEVIKKTLAEANKAKGELTIKYKGGGNYYISIKAEDYKDAEKTLKTAVENVENYASKHDVVMEFARQE
jgi:translation initiation factor 2 subunit 1